MERLKIKSDWSHYAMQYLTEHGNFLVEIAYIYTERRSMMSRMWRRSRRHCMAYAAKCHDEKEELFTGNPDVDKPNFVTKKQFKAFVKMSIWFKCSEST